MASKVIHAIYTDDDVLMHAVKKVRQAKHHIEEVYCPFPVHGLDKAMGIAPTRAHTTPLNQFKRMYANTLGL